MILLAAYSSLPLMGIRNQGPYHGATNEVRLTTPHGDQEHPADAHVVGDRLLLTTPHAWGSGTDVVERLYEMDKDSLPLMGIRNEVHAVVAVELHDPHYPSWGSGTRSIGVAIILKRA